MNKILKYFSLIPKRVKLYGVETLIYKIIIDVTIYFKLEYLIPKNKRWMMAHSFHTSWKPTQVKMYGKHGYNDRIDAKSREVLNDFYETGLDYRGETFVDVGCGTRGVLPIIKAKQKIGIDPTLSKAKKTYELDEIDIYYLSEKAEDISLESGTVDMVCCNNSLNHFEDPDIALAQIHRILKPGGLFLLEVFLEPENIAHTVEFNTCTLTKLLSKYFTPVMVKHEQLKVSVEIDENMDGHLPMRWGGIFKK